MSEYIADSLLDKLGLNRANLLYVGGGHAYFVLANTEKTVETLVQFEKDFNQFWPISKPDYMLPLVGEALRLRIS